MNPIALTDAYRTCELVVRKHSSSFYRAFSILPEPKRNAVWAVYAFCRTVDDLVDETPEHAREYLQAFEDCFNRFLNGTTPNHPHWIALKDVFSRYPMDPLPFRDMIQGQRQDLTQFHYSTSAELDHYCYLVAGTVGLMLLPILADRVTPVMRHKAIRLGRAMQITNILRDVAEDYNRGRVYLPQDLMNRFGYNPEEIPKGLASSAWTPLFAHLTESAEQDYIEGLSAHPYYPRDSRASLSAAGLIYRQILVEAQSAGGDVFTKRIRVSGKRKTAILLSLLLQRETWRKPLSILEADGSLTC
ncbi:phytoene/squalene synthase family protein [Paenibacillus sp. FJAT-26967]|uniref:phytoene/squalene synthase family protein n=1 Tax=Paenibacillus sp. FJAT-26967 TaxID=1729690 RepID=UPI00083898DB|nr:phytoene/squalene synthase family protein [Paenibacillus sp. FJAT-26967]